MRHEATFQQQRGKARQGKARFGCAEFGAVASWRTANEERQSTWQACLGTNVMAPASVVEMQAVCVSYVGEPGSVQDAESTAPTR